jgi:Ca2+-binding RTX toxin-like protein
VNGKSKADKFNGGSEANAFNGGNGNDRINGGAGGDMLMGGKGNDRIDGGTGADVLSGGAGKDQLTGGAGADTFLFDTKPGKSNIDKIRDFSVTDDIIALENAVFSALAEGPLAASAFHIGKKAGDADDRIIYNAKKGELLYDADGSGGKKAVVFATITKNLALTADDFLVF